VSHNNEELKRMISLADHVLETQPKHIDYSTRICSDGDHMVISIHIHVQKSTANECFKEIKEIVNA